MIGELDGDWNDKNGRFFKKQKKTSNGYRDIMCSYAKWSVIDE
jgi:hypothetical protein